jgi:hypothetical protein
MHRRFRSDCPHLPPTGSSWIAVALISASVVHAARGPSPLTVRLMVGHGAGVSGEPRPGRPDAAGTQGRLLDGRLPTGCLETRGDPGQAEGCQPRDHPASQASAGGQAPGTSRRSPPVRFRSPGRSKVRLPSMSAPSHAVTENAHTAAAAMYAVDSLDACHRGRADHVDLSSAPPVPGSCVPECGPVVRSDGSMLWLSRKSSPGRIGVWP